MRKKEAMQQQQQQQSVGKPSTKSKCAQVQETRHSAVKQKADSKPGLVQESQTGPSADSKSGQGQEPLETPRTDSKVGQAQGTGSQVGQAVMGPKTMVTRSEVGGVSGGPGMQGTGSIKGQVTGGLTVQGAGSKVWRAAGKPSGPGTDSKAGAAPRPDSNARIEPRTKPGALQGVPASGKSIGRQVAAAGSTPLGEGQQGAVGCGQAPLGTESKVEQKGPVAQRKRDQEPSSKLVGGKDAGAGSVKKGVTGSESASEVKAQNKGTQGAPSAQSVGIRSLPQKGPLLEAEKGRSLPKEARIDKEAPVKRGESAHAPGYVLGEKNEPASNKPSEKETPDGVKKDAGEADPHLIGYRFGVPVINLEPLTVASALPEAIAKDKSPGGATPLAVLQTPPVQPELPKAPQTLETSAGKRGTGTVSGSDSPSETSKPRNIARLETPNPRHPALAESLEPQNPVSSVNERFLAELRAKALASQRRKAADSAPKVPAPTPKGIEAAATQPGMTSEASKTASERPKSASDALGKVSERLKGLDPGPEQPKKPSEAFKAVLEAPEKAPEPPKVGSEAAANASDRLKTSCESPVGLSGVMGLEEASKALGEPFQEQVRRMMIAATEGLDEWTVSQLGEFTAMQEKGLEQRSKAASKEGISSAQPASVSGQAKPAFGPLESRPVIGGGLNPGPQFGSSSNPTGTSYPTPQTPPQKVVEEPATQAGRTSGALERLLEAREKASEQPKAASEPSEKASESLPRVSGVKVVEEASKGLETKALGHTKEPSEPCEKVAGAKDVQPKAVLKEGIGSAQPAFVAGQAKPALGTLKFPTFVTGAVKPGLQFGSTSNPPGAPLPNLQFPMFSGFSRPSKPQNPVLGGNRPHISGALGSDLHFGSGGNPGTLTGNKAAVAPSPPQKTPAPNPFQAPFPTFASQPMPHAGFKTLPTRTGGGSAAPLKAQRTASNQTLKPSMPAAHNQLFKDFPTFSAPASIPPQEIGSSRRSAPVAFRAEAGGSALQGALLAGLRFGFKAGSNASAAPQISKPFDGLPRSMTEAGSGSPFGGLAGSGLGGVESGESTKPCAKESQQGAFAFPPSWSIVNYHDLSKNASQDPKPFGNTFSNPQPFGNPSQSPATFGFPLQNPQPSITAQNPALLGSSRQDPKSFGIPSQNSAPLGNPFQNPKLLGFSFGNPATLGSSFQNPKPLGFSSQNPAPLGHIFQNPKPFGNASQSPEALGKNLKIPNSFAKTRQNPKPFGRTPQNLKPLEIPSQNPKPSERKAPEEVLAATIQALRESIQRQSQGELPQPASANETLPAGENSLTSNGEGTTSVVKRLAYIKKRKNVLVRRVTPGKGEPSVSAGGSDSGAEKVWGGALLSKSAGGLGGKKVSAGQMPGVKKGKFLGAVQRKKALSWQRESSTPVKVQHTPSLQGPRRQPGGLFVSPQKKPSLTWTLGGPIRPSVELDRGHKYPGNPFKTPQRGPKVGAPKGSGKRGIGRSVKKGKVGGGQIAIQRRAALKWTREGVKTPGRRSVGVSARRSPLPKSDDKGSLLTLLRYVYATRAGCW
jgi:hypothetical protein